ncbi:hypothetical protein ACFO1B_04825 [Dactylosporangium siamense]|uniref:Uncharacterized protein n=1 Tax=Dactylosporangium siamense TaxID=685454 RepID=A0A919PIE7_9ACTN|nr:hypothetical protein [Dactylosporangium siamense]GIG42788.1 hypothetical protein Dsi01nite_008290 [Dactylosporangium siamense]
MRWLRWWGDDDETPPPADPQADQLTDPEQIRKRIVEAEHFVNQHASRLPAAAVVKARWLTDTLREILDTSANRPLDIHAVLLVRNTVDDFLPTTLRSYLTLEASMRDRPAPVPELLSQLDLLQEAASNILVAVRGQDRDALATQGNFLRTKFTRSDLDLP